LSEGRVESQNSYKRVQVTWEICTLRTLSYFNFLVVW
jgi:hypothetical protein